jgi:hypothetical protein
MWRAILRRRRGETDAKTEYVGKADKTKTIAVSEVGARSVKKTKVTKETQQLTAAVGRALRRAAKVARKTARMHGTPIYVWKNGKVVAEKP